MNTMNYYHDPNASSSGGLGTDEEPVYDFLVTVGTEGSASLPSYVSSSSSPQVSLPAASLQDNLLIRSPEQPDQQLTKGYTQYARQQQAVTALKGTAVATTATSFSKGKEPDLMHRDSRFAIEDTEQFPQYIHTNGMELAGAPYPGHSHASSVMTQSTETFSPYMQTTRFDFHNPVMSSSSSSSYQGKRRYSEADSVSVQSPEYGGGGSSSGYPDPDIATAGGRGYDMTTAAFVAPRPTKSQRSTSASESPNSPASSVRWSERSKEKNRMAASRCRQKSKKHIEDLRTRERQLSEQRAALAAQASGLKEEVLSLKNEILRHGDCNDDVIQGYLKKAAKSMV